ncbi:zinc ABC transporter substrate-binding protein [Halobacillus kuroshimensis]|uniref:Zinc ABC transporter substrate-binding protein n=1 Tax=Halobacillus kuroshimensis TaxID=302481 RepID=A0ABS3DXC8_9BACI|nr:zinc ABC transporter substrate-binding protein [Halobacillus kuroshimensis]MBN8235981.1 zinc ABC transporter substrate-binding protein [Halobacillus kuroshimensis]
MKKFAILSFLLTAVFLLLSACGSEETAGDGKEEEENGDNLKVYTTVYPLQFFTSEIGGDTVDVETILPPGSDAHTYEPTTKEMVDMAGADLFVYNGAGLEGYAEKISEALKPEGTTVLEAAGDMDLQKGVHDHGAEDSHEGETAEEHAEHDHSHEGETEEEHAEHEDSHEGHDHGENDPHVWLDPVRSIELAEGIKEQLIELNPEKEDLYEENFQTLKGKLTALDEQFHKQVESQPKDKIIVSHAAYGYWEEAYGIDQIAVSGLSPTNEPSQKDLEEIIELAEEEELRYVIFEQNVTPKVSKVIQDEIGAEPLQFHNLAVLTEEDVENGEDYFSLMEQNLEVLYKAFAE